jgi:hypothetical protein
VLSAVVSRGSSGAHAHNEEDMLSLVKEQLLRQQLLEEGEQLLFKHEAKNIYNIECRPKILSVIKLKQSCGSGSDFPFLMQIRIQILAQVLYILTKKYTFIHSFSKLHWFKHEGRRGTEPRQKKHIQHRMQTKNPVCCGSMKFWYGSRSADP